VLRVYGSNVEVDEHVGPDQDSITVRDRPESLDRTIIRELPSDDDVTPQRLILEELERSEEVCFGIEPDGDGRAIREGVGESIEIFDTAKPLQRCASLDRFSDEVLR
jgi:hypothetical protein